MGDVEMMEQTPSTTGVIVAAPASRLGRPQIHDLYAADREKCLQCVRALRNWIIGSNRQKALVYEENLLPKLLSLLNDPSTSGSLKNEIAVVLGSLAKGSAQQMAVLVAAGTVDSLVLCIGEPFSPFVEACLRCLSSIFNSELAPVDRIYQDVDVVPTLLHLMSGSITARECVCRILSKACVTETHQAFLSHAGIIDAVAPGIGFSQPPSIHQVSLNCLSALCYDNAETSSSLLSSKHGDSSVIEGVIGLLQRRHPMKTQLAAAKCITYVYRSGAAFPYTHLIADKVMPTLIRGSKEDAVLGGRSQRVGACLVLAYLIETEVELQKLALHNHQCLPTLARSLAVAAELQDRLSASADAVKQAAELEHATLSAIAALALSDEEIRRKITSECPIVMEVCMRGLSEEKRNPKLLLAAIRCLHALSRSVEQLRTTFQDRAIWKPLLGMTTNSQSSSKLVSYASAILCNLSLEFSPCREALWDAGILDVFCALARLENESLRLNGFWGLMNMTYRSSDEQKLKIIKCLGSERLLHVLTETPPQSPLVIYVLSFLRNLLSQTQENGCCWDQLVDEVMSEHGTALIQSLVFVLEGAFSVEAKELAICVLSNVAAGDSAKDLIITNDDVLQKILYYLGSSSGQLQHAALTAIMNLVWKDDPGFLERQQRLRQLGVHKILQQLPEDDPLLSERMKAALQQIS